MRQKGYALKTEKLTCTGLSVLFCFTKNVILRHGQWRGQAVFIQLSKQQTCSINTQKIALNALAFLYNRFLHSRWAILIISLQASLDGYPLYLCKWSATHFAGYGYSQPSYFTLLYGAGLRINECLRLRVKILILIMAASLCMTVRVGKAEQPTAHAPNPSNKITHWASALIQQDDNLQGVGPSLPFALDTNTLLLIDKRRGCLSFPPAPLQPPV